MRSVLLRVELKAIAEFFDGFDRMGKVVGELQQTSRAGLVGYGKFTKAPPVKSPIGLLLREKIRGVLENLTLKVGLDASLGSDRIEAQYKNARQQVDRLTPALLAKAFRGELVPQDPNDEPASVLLERVKEARSIAQPAKAKRKAVK